MELWTEVYAIATICTGAVLAVTFVLMVIQQIAYRKTHTLQGFIQVVDWLQKEDVRKSRSIVYRLQKKPFKNWTKDDRLTAERVCHNFDVVGKMYKLKLIPKSIPETWKTTIIRTWYIVKPLVQQYREERPHPTLWDNYEWLAEEVFRVESS